MRILLDTSAYVGFKRSVEVVVEIIVSAESILFSPIVVGELMFGFRNGNRFKKNMDDLNNFLQHEVVEIIQIGKITSDRYSRIASHLKRQGTPIPSNDVWIAAQAMEHGIELITSDRHFENIASLVHTIF
ncbi:MAG: type II toxin-antitoxin system VapC family toxin [Candidatus Desulfatibia sp.]|jgi:tRNA(fMet)-specific endonuclease VapC|uniref:type II toxin-antitoxin system VapC family toxin n=1 Tax=Candidatus Desulfatibia sp. TaxID=3101189 RepID=UPI002F305D72